MSYTIKQLIEKRLNQFYNESGEDSTFAFYQAIGWVNVLKPSPEPIRKANILYAIQKLKGNQGKQILVLMQQQTDKDVELITQTLDFLKDAKPDYNINEEVYAIRFFGSVAVEVFD